jgi:hypothetical protein
MEKNLKIKGRGAPSRSTRHERVTPHAQHKHRIEKILNICVGCKWEIAPLPGKRRSYESKTA